MALVITEGDGEAESVSDLPCPFCWSTRLNGFSHYSSETAGLVETRMIQCLDCKAEAPQASWEGRKPLQ